MLTRYTRSLELCPTEELIKCNLISRAIEMYIEISLKECIGWRCLRNHKCTPATWFEAFTCQSCCPWATRCWSRQVEFVNYLTYGRSIQVFLIRLNVTIRIVWRPKWCPAKCIPGRFKKVHLVRWYNCTIALNAHLISRSHSYLSECTVSC